MTLNDHIVSGFFVGRGFRILRHLSLLLILAVITLSFLWYLPALQVPPYYKLFAWCIYFFVFGGIMYFNMYVAVPRLLLRNRLTTYTLVLVLSACMAILAIILVQSFVLFLKSSDGFSGGVKLFVNIASGMLVFCFIFLGTTSLLLVKQRILSDLKKSELESSILESELKLLKNQVNPHFLFNMLNNANMLLKKDREQASEVLFKLEDLLRYQIHDTIHEEEVLLTSEIGFLTDFLNLEKIRRDNFEFTVSVHESCRQVKVPPLLFIVFAENAVKHNADNENLSYVNLFFRCKGNTLEFVCENSKSGSVTPSGGVGGLGLKNIRRRLDLLFPGTHLLDIREETLKYTVKLTLFV